MSDESEPDNVPDLLPAEQPTVDAANSEEIKKRERKEKRRIRQRDEFWKSVFASEVGRREMWALLQDAQAFETVFGCGPNGSPQPEASWFYAGKRDYGQRLYQTWLLRDPHAIALMHAENDPRFQKRKSVTDGS